ncbi:LysM peptidoglycan-binding domain-containing protein [Streptomyces sp.]|uniref:transglycosylase SLT domain-containing protein n=1 Tax=Streptomyces sp. TaxID=1931 RepID=UPI002D7823DB|nr:LysM peptidoglycan-binding domain-containing protein [Streptomyces sp.]HET6360132.1 LysM peptidoglycan-binding domain-containing protein [Streptomyces sp.]
MPAKGKHRRPKSSAFSRGLAVAGTGGAALVLPVIATTAASAQTAPQSTPAAKTSAAAPALAKAAPALAKKAATTTYSVVAGDSLSKIADQLNVSGGWKKLYKDNRRVVGDDPRLIHPGLKLTIGKKAKAAPASDRADRADRSKRTTKLTQAKSAPAAKPKKTYSNDLDGWIKESLDVMAKHGIPGSYDGIHRNIMRESSGNPLAINNWDSNAAAGTPSKGLLQVIDPTFFAYHVPGTSMDSYDPVANITAACNYAADKYGSIDNVNGAY